MAKHENADTEKEQLHIDNQVNITLESGTVSITVEPGAVVHIYLGPLGGMEASRSEQEEHD